MKPEDYKKNTLYIRQNKGKWEVLVKTELGQALRLENLLSKEMAIKASTFLLWGINTFGADKYGTELEKLDGAPEGVEYPVVEQDLIN